MPFTTYKARFEITFSLLDFAASWAFRTTKSPPPKNRSGLATDYFGSFRAETQRAFTKPSAFLMFCTDGREIFSAFAMAEPV